MSDQSNALLNQTALGPNLPSGFGELVPMRGVGSFNRRELRTNEYTFKTKSQICNILDQQVQEVLIKSSPQWWWARCSAHVWVARLVERSGSGCSQDVEGSWGHIRRFRKLPNRCSPWLSVRPRALASGCAFLQ